MDPRQDSPLPLQDMDENPGASQSQTGTSTEEPAQSSEQDMPVSKVRFASVYRSPRRKFKSVLV